MSNKKLRLILLGSLGLLIMLFVGICFMGLSALSSKSQRLVELKLENRVLENQLSSIGPAKAEVQKYSYFKEVAKTVIPNDKDQAKAVMDITRMADKSGILLQSITFPISNLGAGSATAAPADTSAPGGSAASVTSKAISQAKPVMGINGLYSLELTVTPDSGANIPADKKVTYPKMLKFLRSIEQNRRTAQITQVNIQTQTNSADSTQDINFNLTLNIFIKP